MRIRPGLASVLIVLLIAAEGRLIADEPAPLRVQLEVGRGPYFVGQGVELGVGVTAGDRRPTLELPRLPNADLWVVDTSFKPVSVSAIGRVVSGANVFLTRIRLVARRVGTLTLPPIVARLDGRIGRSQAVRLVIEPVPLEGRPGVFLGGVGEFTVQSRVTPASVPVGQPLRFSLTLRGPGAWGASSPPALDRLGRLAIQPQIEALPEEATLEPPSRTFSWRLRPTRPGEDVLPPLVIAAFDPASRRYITRASPGVPVKVVAVPILNQRDFPIRPIVEPQRRHVTTLVWAGMVLAVVGGAIGALQLGRRLGWRARTGPAAARAFARDAAFRWSRVEGTVSLTVLGRGILDDLVEYARLGAGRPPGALTPGEADEVVRRVTGRDELAVRAAILCRRCDRVLFSDRTDAEEGDIAAEARGVFEALGRAVGSPRALVSGRTSRTSD